MNDAQLHAPAVADIDNPGILVTGPLRLFRGADLVDLSLGDDGSGRRVSRPGLGVDRHRNQNRHHQRNCQCSALHSVLLSHPKSSAMGDYCTAAARSSEFVNCAVGCLARPEWALDAIVAGHTRLTCRVRRNLEEDR
jgi:hypothetical protein